MKKSMIVGLITFIALGLATGYYFLSYAPHQAAVTKFEVRQCDASSFEAGREQIGKNGIIRDAKVHQNVLESVTAMAVEEGFSVLGLDFSPIQGGHGNIEFLAYLKKEESASNQVLADIEEVVERAHSQFKNE